MNNSHETNTLLEQVLEQLPLGVSRVRDGLEAQLMPLIERQLDGLNLASKTDFEQLKQRMDALEQHCSALETVLNELKQRKPD